MTRLWEKFFIGTALVILILSSGNINAAESKDEIPQIIVSGLNAYAAKGPGAAISAWIKGGPIEGDKAALSQANLFGQIESFSGKYTGGYSLIGIDEFTSTAKMVYIQMNFEKGPVFGQFLCYLKGKEWIITGKFNFHTDPKLVIPEHVLRK